MNDVHETSATRHQALRTRLVDTAEAVMATHGLRAIKARALATEVGCALGAIYTVFADLDELILDVNARTMAQMDTCLGTAFTHAANAGPRGQMLALANAYLDYAATNRPRWDGLFSHRLPPGRSLPAAFAQQQAELFARIEAPIAALCPALAAHPRALLARTVFSAVHGVVSLGLDQRVAELDTAGLRAQLDMMVRALAAGLPAAPES